ncbi:MAG: hypothetical protein HYU67_00085 [Flavobacteriia bacterium]|nr:hypothetical protein [Flavobacteriia bacterium]
MELYNKVMLYFWLSMSFVSALAITYMGFQDGFDRWVYYYIIPVLALLMYLLRKYMLKRMQKHLEYLKQKENERFK